MKIIRFVARTVLCQQIDTLTSRTWAGKVVNDNSVCFQGDRTVAQQLKKERLPDVQGQGVAGFLMTNLAPNGAVS